MIRLFLAAMIAVVSLPAFAATIEIGAALGGLQDYVNAIVTIAITALVGWVLYLVKSKLNISIDDSMRDALQTWLQRQASSLVADGAVKVRGLKIDVSNQAVADVANLALKEIPDAAAHFGLTPDKLAEMIKDKIPHVPAVAAVAAQTATPA